MKHIISKILICIVFGLSSNIILAYEYGDITYEVNESNQAIVTGIKNERQSYIIDSIEHNNEKIPVVAIGKKAFYGCSFLENITLPKTLERIEEYSFYRCGLKSLELPDAVKIIDNSAFSFCSNLTEMRLPSSLISIGRSAFSNSGLESIVIPASVSEIAKGAFSSCENLSSINVESGNVVYDSRDNSNAIIQKQGNVLLVGCMNTIIPEGIVTIGENAFYGSRLGELGDVKLPLTLKAISSYAFYNCKLMSLEIPDAVENIGDNAFLQCSNMTEVVFSPSSSLLSIGRSAFSYTSIVSICIPKTVMSIGKNAFSNCKQLEMLQVESANEFYESPNNCNAILQGDKLIVGCNKTIIPSNITAIGDGAFYGSGFGGDILLPASIITIGESGFYNCDNIKSITIQNGTTDIGRYAFYGCSTLKTVYLASSLGSIGKNAFQSCSRLKDVVSQIHNPFAIDNSVFSGVYETATLTVPDGTVELYKNTEGWSRFKMIRGENDPEIIAEISNPTAGFLGTHITQAGYTAMTIQTLNVSGLLNGTDIKFIRDMVINGNLTKLDIQRASIVSGGDPYYGEGSSEQRTKDNVIGAFMFSDCKKLSAISLPKTVKLIEFAFSDCDNLLRLDIPESCVEFGVMAVTSCPSLTTITVPVATRTFDPSNCSFCPSLESIEVSSDNYSLRSIDGVLFSKNMDELIKYPMGKQETSYVIPESVMSIGDYAFSHTTITKIKIPDGVWSIGSGAFQNCNNLAEIELPQSIVEIGMFAFEDCEKLSKLILPERLTEIPDFMASYCNKLSYLYLPSKIKTIGYAAFSSCVMLSRIDCNIPDIKGVSLSADSSSDKVNVFDNISNGCTWHVLPGTSDDYRAQSWWVDSWSIIDDLELSQIWTPYSNRKNREVWYAIDGKRLNVKSSQNDGEKIVEGLSKGIYIMNGQKIMVR